MPRVVAYTWADGTAANTVGDLDSTSRMGVIEQPSSPTESFAKPLTPLPFYAPEEPTDQLRTWAAGLDTAAPTGVYSLTYSPTTRRVTMATTNSVAIRPVLPEQTAAWTGITQTLTGFATSWTGDSEPGAVLECVGIEVEPILDWSQVDEKVYRHGRARFFGWGNHDAAKVTLHCLASQFADRKPYCLTGRVRVYPGSQTTDYGYDDAVGIVDGYIVATGQIEEDGEAEWITIPLVLAIPRA